MNPWQARDLVLRVHRPSFRPSFRFVLFFCFFVFSSFRRCCNLFRLLLVPKILERLPEPPQVTQLDRDMIAAKRMLNKRCRASGYYLTNEQKQGSCFLSCCFLLFFVRFDSWHVSKDVERYSDRYHGVSQSQQRKLFDEKFMQTQFFPRSCAGWQHRKPSSEGEKVGGWVGVFVQG